MIRLILASILLAGCTQAPLADRISMELMQRKAKAEGKYCYINVMSEKYCLLYKGIR